MMRKILGLFYTSLQADLLTVVYKNIWTFLKYKLKFKKHSINLLIDTSASAIHQERFIGDESWDKIVKVLPCTSLRVFVPVPSGDIQVFLYPIENESKTFSEFLSSMRKVTLKNGGIPQYGIANALVETVHKFNAVNKKPFETLVVTDGCDFTFQEAFRKVKKPVYLTSYLSEEIQKEPKYVSYQP